MLELPPTEPPFKSCAPLSASHGAALPPARGPSLKPPTHAALPATTCNVASSSVFMRCLLSRFWQCHFLECVHQPLSFLFWPCLASRSQVFASLFSFLHDCSLHLGVSIRCVQCPACVQWSLTFVQSVVAEIHKEISKSKKKSLISFAFIGSPNKLVAFNIYTQDHRDIGFSFLSRSYFSCIYICESPCNSQ